MHGRHTQTPARTIHALANFLTYISLQDRKITSQDSEGVVQNKQGVLCSAKKCNHARHNSFVT